MNESTKQTITRSEYLALVGIQMLGRRLDAMQKELIKETRKITGEVDESGHSADFVYDARELDDMLRILGITVQD